jgi:hypothetical protein
MANVDDILEECIEQVMSGRSTVDDCLAAYPQYADVLRPLVQTALEIEALDRLEASPGAFQAGKRVMMETVAQKERDGATSRAVLPRSIRRYLGLLQPAGSAGARVVRLTLVGGLAVATVLVWLGVAGLLLRTWYAALVPQTCVVADASGIAQIQTSPGDAWKPLVAGSILQTGHRIRTGSPASVTVSFFDGSTSLLGPHSELVIAQVGAKRDGSGKVVVVQQVAGTTYSRVDSEQDSLSLFQIQTPSASVAVHGTKFRVGVNPDNSTSVVVIEGEVTVTGQEVTIMLTDGQETLVQVDQAPGPVVLAPPEELVEGPSGGEPTLELPEAEASVEPGGPAGPVEPDASATEPAAATGPSSPEAPVVTGTPTSTSEPVQLGTSTATPKVPTPTATPKPPTPTSTRRAPTPTSTRKPALPTATPKPPTPTATLEPPTATATPSPSTGPTEVVEVFQATYYVSKEELRIKARTSLPGCTLTLVGFGPMAPEGGHWLYVERRLHPDDVPSTVTVRSSCGGSGTSPVVWE